MNLKEAIILGAIQGFTEFLPVSSSGHLVIAQKILKVALPGLTFEVMVHLGTLFAVLVFYRRDIVRILKAFFSEIGGKGRKKGVWRNYEARLVPLLVVATIPAALVGLFLKEYVEAAFGSVRLVGVMLLVTGTVLWRAEKKRKGRRKEPDLKMGDALYIGFFQALAVIPGLSRSGLTVSAALGRRIERPLAARFSFLLSIPVIAGSAFVDLYSVMKAKTALPWLDIFAGTFTSFVTGIFAVALVVKAIRAGRLRYFAVYCWVVGSAALVLGFLFA